MSSYMKRINHEYPFPQANSQDRIIDVVALVCARYRDDGDIAKAMGTHPRQGRYYADAAGWLGLIRLSGGYWRAEKTGHLMNSLPPNAQLALIGRVLSSKPVFSDVLAHYAAHGDVPGADSVISWIQAESPELNLTTSRRRADSIFSWFNFIRPALAELIDDKNAERLSFAA